MNEIAAKAALSQADRVVLARLGGKVERCHIIPHRESYSNAAHSWGVAMLMLQVWPRDFARLAAVCICHDVPEAWVGDIPAHTKARAPQIRTALRILDDEIFDRLQLPRESDLDARDLRKLQNCDRLELWLWAQEELELGNHHAREIVTKLEGWFSMPDGLLPEAMRLFRNLKANPRPDKGLVMDDY